MIHGMPPSTERFLLDVSRIQKREERAQREITSGLKLQQVSDNPNAVTRLLDARAGLERVAQSRLNLGRVKVETDTAEKALAQAVEIMDKARALGTQGASGHQEASTRRHVAAELESLLERLVGVASTAVEGRHVFSGDTDQVRPYEIDLAVPSGVSAYQGAPSTRRIADHSGATFAVAQSADVIFESANPDENVFLAVNGLRRALLAVDDPPNPPDPTIPSIDTALANLNSASVYLNQHLAGFGLIQNRVDQSLEAAAKLELSLTAQISTIEEADLAESVSSLQQARTNLEAAFTARAQAPQRSLFDYLG
jgi:flagellar hook-associated protein 3 FlgL